MNAKINPTDGVNEIRLQYNINTCQVPFVNDNNGSF